MSEYTPYPQIPFTYLGAKMMKLVFAAVAALFSVAAVAGDHAYIQANFGSPGSDMPSDCGTGSPSTVVNCSIKGNGGKLLAGFKVAPAFALEATYWNFGTDRGEVYDSGGNTIFRVNSDVTAFGLGGAIHFSMTEKWGGIARFGFAKVKSKVSYPINPTNLGDYSETHPKYYAGGSISYAITPMFRLHGDFDYTKVRNDDFDEHGMRLLSVGGSFNF